MEKVQVFLTGGGSNLPFVGDVFSHPWWQQLKVTYPVSALPTPDDFDSGGGRAPFQRMAVAYGLARPKPQLRPGLIISQFSGTMLSPLLQMVPYILTSTQ